MDHYRDMLDFYGEQSGLRQARKHLRWYLDRHAPHTGQDLRQTILQSTDVREVLRSIGEALADLPEARAAA
jgi:tRNA-dihydrouridine synthase